MKISKEKLLWNFLNRARLYHITPHGYDLYFDIKRKISHDEFKVVFDVGANVGQTTYRIARAFSIAVIHCFEPIYSTFNELKMNTKGNPLIHCHQLALGSTKGLQQVILQKNSQINSLCNRIEANENLPIELVRISTLDKFCNENCIDYVDFLKIDTEGFDLEVLEGGRRMLDSGSVKFIQVETGISHTNNEHIPLQQFRRYLEKKGYVLFGLYEQTLEWTGELRLMFCNAVFYLES